MQMTLCLLSLTRHVHTHELKGCEREIGESEGQRMKEELVCEHTFGEIEGRSVCREMETHTSVA
jgi:hypothetical protein